MDPQTPNPKPFEVHVVTSTDSPEFAHLTRALTRSSIVALDAEWKPTRFGHSDRSFPAVSLLQLACRLGESDSVVFLLDLLSVSLPSLWHLLRDLLVSPDVLKLGFRFKQDLVYLSSTFSSHGCDDHGFDRVEPFVDITSIYNYLHDKQCGTKKSKDNKSLTTVCKEILDVSLSKEHQCSDWSQRPLTEEQIAYAAKDAHCLLDIFSVFQAKIGSEWDVIAKLHEPKPNSQNNSNLGLKEILENGNSFNQILRVNISGALDILQATACSDMFQKTASEEGMVLRFQQRSTLPMSESLLKLVKEFRENLVLKESDKKPKSSRRKRRIRTSPSLTQKEVELENAEEWQGPPPWDFSLGGDGCPKFLCDVMVEGLAKHLRCVGIDAAIPNSKRPEARDLIGQASRENRVLLTRDAKLLRHQYTIKNQIYRVKTLLKNEQLTEVIETFQLKISEGQLMSRCTKCNGGFIQKPLTAEEAVEAAKGFQRIPNCLFNKNLEFWQCRDCKQLYWEGTQYKNAVQKFIDVCKLKD